ncbi:helix-turn-helix domain-containing protein [Streptomyces capparidis]
MPRLPPTTPARVYVGTVLRHFRERAGVTQQELGRELHVSGALVNMVEVGRRALEPRLLERADVLLDAGGLLRAAGPLLEGEREALRGPGPALCAARDHLEALDAALPPLSEDTRRHIAALALWALGPSAPAHGE